MNETLNVVAETVENGAEVAETVVTKASPKALTIAAEVAVLSGAIYGAYRLMKFAVGKVKGKKASKKEVEVEEVIPTIEDAE